MERLKQLDLNLLRLLAAIVETGSTKAAALSLGISQASASRGLAQLRQLFGEQLFVRKAHGVEPSELALNLADAANQMMEPLRLALLSYQEYQAASFDGRISLAIDPYLLDEQGPGIARSLHRCFPKARLELITWDSSTIERLLKGQLDYCICDKETALPQDLFTEVLYLEQMQLIARPEHPLLAEENNWPQLAELELVHLPAPLNLQRQNYLELEFQHHGYLPNIVLSTSSVHTALNVVAESDAIMFSSPATAALHPGVRCYAPPPFSPHFAQVPVLGGMLQRRRNHPHYQTIHQTLIEHFSALS